MSERRTGSRGVLAIAPESGAVREDGQKSAGASLLADADAEARPYAQALASQEVALALVVSPDGAICSALPRRGGPPDGFNLNGAPKVIEELWPADLCDGIREHIAQALRSRHVRSARFQVGDGEARHLRFIFVPQGRDRALVIVLDVSAQASALSRMHELAYVDRATTLPTREHFMEELERFTDMLRLKEDRSAVICFSIEQSDGQGNAFSGQSQDLILKELATRLTLELRGANQQEEPDYERYSVAARIDYRQYGVLLPSIQSGQDAESVTARLIESLECPIELGDRQVRVSASAGIALFPQDGTDAETLFENALSAMEDATNSQTDSYKFYSGTVKLRALQRKDLELELKTALDREEFNLDYLPIVDAATEEVVSVEALLRWPQAMFGTQPIHKVISLAEHTGMILPIGDWVVKRSIEQLKRWHEAGHEDLRLAINLSVQQFSRLDFMAGLLAALDGAGVDPGKIDLEINEYLLYRDAMKGYAMCRSLRDRGLGIVIDDYGTGACSLAHFSRSPINAIKIDNSFVANATSSATDRAACAAMIVMAHELGQRVIAEGVETAEQAELLKAQGADLLQGFYYCRPLPATELDDVLDQGRRRRRG